MTVMTLRNEPSLGILGGMGPEATHHFFGEIIEQRSAVTDQDHIRVVIDSNPSIPDRTEYLIGDGPSPLPKLKQSVRVLEGAQVDTIAMPCHTSHYFFEELEASTKVPFIDMITETINFLDKNDVRQCLLLATDGTIETGLYQNDMRVEFISPDDADQTLVMEAIFGEQGIKAGNYEYPVELIERVIQESPTNTVLLGCTELSIIASRLSVQHLVVDPLQLLANRSIRALTPE